MLLDIRPLQGPSAKRGIGTYVRGLLAGLAEEGFGERLAVLVDDSAPLPPLPDAGLLAYRVRRRYRGRLAAFEDAARLRADLAEIRPAVYHATTLSLPSSAPCPLVATLHDLIPWALGGPRMLGERLRQWPGKRQLRQADLVLAVSASAAADGRRLAGIAQSRLRVIPEGVEPGFRPQAGAAGRVRERHRLEPGYLLYFGALDARKDPVGLLKAWRAAQESGLDAPLVLAGEAGSQAPREMGAAVRVGYLEQDQLVDLLNAAGCLLFPSRYEGFGLPLLEAMACGCPVVCYSNSSLPEVAGNAACLVADGDPEELGRAAAEIVKDPKVSAEMRRRGLTRAAAFTWRAAARGVIEAYSELL